MIISSLSEISVCIGTKIKHTKVVIEKSNQTPKCMFGYQLFDRVIYNGQEGFVFGRRSSGSFDI